MDIKGYERLYKISNYGNVYSQFIRRNRKLVLYNNGYYCIAIKIKGVQRSFLIHRLVATHFVSNPENKQTVNHIDGNKFNNRWDNLEWLTLKENIQHGYRTGLLSPVQVKYGEDHSNSIFKESDILDIYKFRKEGLSLQKISSKYNCHLTTIHQIVSGKTWQKLYKDNYASN